jgi:hypothetical protein
VSVDAERGVRTGRCHCFGDVFVCVCVGGRTGDGMRVSVRRSVVAQRRLQDGLHAADSPTGLFTANALNSSISRSLGHCR